jgi:phage gp29-like protein
MAGQLLDRWGNPVKRTALKAEVSAPTVTGIRSPMTGYPGDGLNPQRLANILREADQGDPLRYLELAETIEERDLHYVGVLGTRRRSVAQIDITVEAASEDPADVAKADMLRDWLDRDELADELFDILDAIGKGYSVTEIIWDTSMGQWQPQRLEYRDPRWFRFKRQDLATPLMLDENGQEHPLPAFKFIYSTIKAKSGLALRSGLARSAAWAWMFKAFTQRDWAIFTQTYGQPLRLGKYGAGATEEDKATLFRAVANIAGDCAAIIPEAMTIDFVETKSVGATADLYERRCDWLDKQTSKAVLGQTATTDAVTGGLGSGKEHRQVQEDIERADAKALAAILNRDLVRPWIDLEFGPQKRYPRIKIGRPEVEDLTALAQSLGPMIDRGLAVSQSAVRDRFGIAEPKPDDDLMLPMGQIDAAPAPDTEGADRNSKFKHQRGKFKQVEAASGTSTALQAEAASTGKKTGGVPEPRAEAVLADRMATEAQPGVALMLGQIEAMVEAAGSLEELREMFLAGFDRIDTAGLLAAMERGFVAATGAGQIAAAAESEA